MNGKKLSKEFIEKVVSESYTIADVCRKCDWQPRGDNYKVIKRYIEEYNLSTEHFTGKRTNINNSINKHNVKPLNDILTTKSYYSTNGLKNRLFKEGIKLYKCECCGINEWNDKEIGLQLHHINGDNTDNRIENLQILCPNCHSQTDSYCGNKNMKLKHIYYCNNCGEQIDKTKTGYCAKCYKLFIEGGLNTNTYSVTNSKTIIGNCVICNKELYFKNDSGVCLQCNREIKSKIIEKDLLCDLIKNKSFSEIGRMYHVSDNTIRKWCKKYNLPFRKKDIL